MMLEEVSSSGNEVKDGLDTGSCASASIVRTDMSFAPVLGGTTSIPSQLKIINEDRNHLQGVTWPPDIWAQRVVRRQESVPPTPVGNDNFLSKDVEKREPDADGIPSLRRHELTDFMQPPSRFAAARAFVIGDDVSLNRSYVDVNGVEAESDLKNQAASARVNERVDFTANEYLNRSYRRRQRSFVDGDTCTSIPVDDETEVRGPIDVPQSNSRWSLFRIASSRMLFLQIARDKRTVLGSARRRRLASTICDQVNIAAAARSRLAVMTAGTTRAGNPGCRQFRRQRNRTEVGEPSSARDGYPCDQTHGYVPAHTKDDWCVRAAPRRLRVSR